WNAMNPVAAVAVEDEQREPRRRPRPGKEPGAEPQAIGGLERDRLASGDTGIIERWQVRGRKVDQPPLRQPDEDQGGEDERDEDGSDLHVVRESYRHDRV